MYKRVKELRTGTIRQATLLYRTPSEVQVVGTDHSDMSKLVAPVYLTLSVAALLASNHALPINCSLRSSSFFCRLLIYSATP